MQPRQTAYKIWIKDLLDGEFLKEEGEFQPGYIKINGLKVSRINIIGTITDKYLNTGGNFLSLVIDDSSGLIKINCWKEDVALFNKIEVGDPVLLIGKIKQKNERYLLPEIMRKITNKSWATLRFLELTKIYGKRTFEEKPVLEPQQAEYDGGFSVINRQRVLNIIEKFNDLEGVEFLDLIETSGLNKVEAEKIINELIKEGEIFEFKKGRLKLAS